MYALFSWLHILLAMFWVGGMLFTVAVLVPMSRNKMFENRRGELFSIAGTIFSRISWVIFPLMIVTGLLALSGKGYAMSDLVTGWFIGSPYGQTLVTKLSIFGLVLIVSGIHDFWLGPKAAVLMDSDPTSAVTRRTRKFSSWLGRLNLLLGLLIVWYAVGLVRG